MVNSDRLLVCDQVIRLWLVCDSVRSQ